ncbi:hypothetical protein [Beggiatoa leptomitoformis]|uniref:Uncharacterized protein n=1 Tax=Beggiatoa leptomitoformis TaxID=288004 RepID=A0A2N9YEB0_9GAMM|nr:hypothetical protein [Beggiatoa leptomitoformis]ALG68831.1 hypothetical protein AL038_15410 [Beggiatoa leptomitoformis]AUI68804.1 hypothetical protein BLE401_08845 [Beggiatoa leptomitoformis]
MTIAHPAALWAKTSTFEPIHIDCTTAIMLKILDSKCKMGIEEQTALTAIYDVIKDQQGELLDARLHPLIASARQQITTEILQDVHEQRIHAEEVIPKPVMKAFKQRLREALMPEH